LIHIIALSKFNSIAKVFMPHLFNQTLISHTNAFAGATTR
jgi:hypothetical protein